jgi:hypothetical protein
VADECADAQFENRASANETQLLEGLTAEARAPTTGGDDRCDKHRL